MDSGAFGLYNANVLKRHEKTDDRKIEKAYIKARQARMGGESKRLDPPPTIRGRGDFSYYDLTKGSDFHQYCERYAAFMKSMNKLTNGEMIFANVDVITNPELTWKVQEWFEKEHGLRPVPVVHAGTPMRFLDRYLEAGHSLIGLGGGQGMGQANYIRWADNVFLHLCPKWNDYKPVVRVHGFALTAWELMIRWPWWSVDSATWVKLGAYGWILVPFETGKGEFVFDRPPHQISISHHSVFKDKDGKHIDHLTKTGKALSQTIQKWLKRCNAEMGTVDEKGDEIVYGVISNFIARAAVNVHYMHAFQEWLPPYPRQLDHSIVDRNKISLNIGFGIFKDELPPTTKNLYTPPKGGEKTRIYFSGSRGNRAVPEHLAPELKPHVMLTFHAIDVNGTKDRVKVFLNSLKKKEKKNDQNKTR